MSVAFNEENEKQLQKLLGRYPQKRGALLPVLWLAQHQFGWLSPEVLDYVAARLELFPADVLATATFYTMFYKKPMGKHHVQVCTNLSCYLRGSDELLHVCEKKLGIHVGETTADGQFSLDHVECLGSCGTAPMMQVNLDYYENLTPAEVEKLLDGWSKT